MTATSDIITDPAVIAHLRARYDAINASHAGNGTQNYSDNALNLGI
jgi:hypothetical protein